MLKYLQANWVQIATSIGFGTLISSIIGLVQSNKKNNLEYITKERSEWRKNLHDIVGRLKTTDDVKDNLSKLETYLNPYGYRIENKLCRNYFLKDGHIWDLLRKIRDNENNVDQSHIEKFRCYLNMLLKYDWERSKREVKLRFIELIFNLIRLVSTIVIVYLIFFIYPKSNNLIVYFKIIFNFIITLFIWFIEVINENMIKKEIRTKNMEVLLLSTFGFWPYLWIGRELDMTFKFTDTWENVALGIIIGSTTLLMILLMSYLDTPTDEYILQIKRMEARFSKSEEKNFELSEHKDELTSKLNDVIDEAVYIKRNIRINKKIGRLEKKIRHQKHKTFKKVLKAYYVGKKKRHKFKLLKQIIRHY